MLHFVRGLITTTTWSCDGFQSWMVCYTGHQNGGTLAGEFAVCFEASLATLLALYIYISGMKA